MFIIEEQKLYIGLDLGNEFSQLSYYDETLYEPRSISQQEGEEAYLIPSVLGANKESGQWYYGDEAVSMARRGELELLALFIQKIVCGESIVYYDKEWEPVEVVKKFLRKCLYLVTRQFPDMAIGKLVVSLENKTKDLVSVLYEALTSLGLDSNRVEIISHQESYVYYALRQKKELWMNDIGLFDFTPRGMYFYRIYMNHRTTPITVGIEKKEYTEYLSYEMLDGSKEDAELTYIFDRITQNALYKKIVSTIYVTGYGFYGGWHQSVLEGLCVGRRVFYGQNIYTIGACYGAKELAGQGKLNDYLILNENMILFDISIKIYADTRFQPVYLVKAGTMWHEATKEIEVIPDEETELELDIFDVMTQQKKTFFLHIDELEGRPNRTTILGISLKFLDPKTCVLQVKDRGFGNMYPSTNRIWEKEIHL
ncbi:MAG: hypothetical protein IKL07_05090 [Clostridium sp.]|nr:hypothetical protein [Clostridium sp.]